MRAIIFLGKDAKRPNLCRGWDVCKTGVADDAIAVRVLYHLHYPLLKEVT
jgi:hypothetical protein